MESTEGISKKPELNTCFVLMPISDTDAHPNGHFRRVYEDIIVPACEASGFVPSRADDERASNLIHLDILRKLLDADICVCDLTSTNPNVMFELGVRQAFDKPVVLIQEKGTPKIFDIQPLRYIEYDGSMKYHAVLEMQRSLSLVLKATYQARSDPKNVNSIVKLLSLGRSAAVPNLSEENREALTNASLHAELREIRELIAGIVPRRRTATAGIYAPVEHYNKDRRDGIGPGFLYYKTRLREISSDVSSSRETRIHSARKLLKDMEGSYKVLIQENDTLEGRQALDALRNSVRDLVAILENER